ncbi:MAG TPA: HAMP domain-containing sensor histidine kinase [Alphaproteobacteria bacterium]
MNSDVSETARESQGWAREHAERPASPRGTQIIAAVLVCGTVASFALDSLTPRGVGDGIGYPILLTLCLWFRGRHIIFTYAAIATVLTVIAGFLATPGVSVEATVLNRAYIIAVVWTMAAILAQRMRLDQRLRESEREAHAASQAKSNFLANMSHELRTPLTAIIGFADLIGRESAGPVGQRKYLEYAGTIQKSGAHLLSMVDDVLDLSKIEANKYRLDEGEVSLSHAAAEATRLVAVAARSAGLTIEDQVAPELPHLRGDRRAVRQLLLNLLSNAIKFTPNGGRISIGAGTSDEGLWLTVADSGIGIAKEHLAKLGAPFVRFSAGPGHSDGGTGLGLALCRRLAELHDGRLEVESEPGRGTTARVVFPKARIVAG